MKTSKSKDHSGASRLPLYLGAAALAVAAGFGAVYVNTAPESNRGVPATRATQGQQDAGSRGPLASFAKGEMTGFVARAVPEAVPALTFEDAGGTARTLDDWKGKVVLVNLWATWCAPCRKEMPSLDRLQAQLGGDNFEVVAISVDKSGTDLPRSFLERTNVTSLKFYHDKTGAVGGKLKAFGMPTTVLIDRGGREVGRLTGPAEWDSPDAVALVKAAIGK